MRVPLGSGFGIVLLAAAVGALVFILWKKKRLQRFLNLIVLLIIGFVAALISPRAEVARIFKDREGFFLQTRDGDRVEMFLNENHRECVGLSQSRPIDPPSEPSLRILVDASGNRHAVLESRTWWQKGERGRFYLAQTRGSFRVAREGGRTYRLILHRLETPASGTGDQIPVLRNEEGMPFVPGQVRIPVVWTGRNWAIEAADVAKLSPFMEVRSEESLEFLSSGIVPLTSDGNGTISLITEQDVPITAPRVLRLCETRQEIVFLRYAIIGDVLRQISVVGIMAVGMTLVILTAGIDLSVGSLLAFSAVLFALCSTKWIGHPFFLEVLPRFGIPTHLGIVLTGVLLTIAASTALGAFNGVCVAKGRIQPFIVTLSTMLGARGLAQLISGERLIKFHIPEEFFQNRPPLAEAMRGLQGFVNAMGQRGVMIPLFAFIAVAFTVLLSGTRMGRHVIAVGGNEKAARLSGVRVDRVKILVYSLSGFLCAVAGILQMGRENQADFNTGKGYELQVIAAVVLGGTSLLGGRGSVWGSVVGAVTIQVIRKTMDLRQVRDAWQDILLGAIIILAVLIQSRKREH